MRQALQDDIPTLLALMSEFYSESGYELDRAAAETAFAAILSDNRLGYVWLIEDENKIVGYLALTLRFGMEYGGLIGCLDDLFVVPQSRNKGLSTAALIQVRDFCRPAGFAPSRLRLASAMAPRKRFYRRVGLVEAPGRQLLALALAKTDACRVTLRSTSPFVPESHDSRTHPGAPTALRHNEAEQRIKERRTAAGALRFTGQQKRNVSRERTSIWPSYRLALSIRKRPFVRQICR